MKLLRSVLLAASITVVVLALGCVSHKPPPAVIHANNYTAEPAKTQKVIPPENRILGLKEAIRIGLTNNPTYKQKQLAIISAWSIFYSNLANYSPLLNLKFGAKQFQWVSSAPPPAKGVNTKPFTNWQGNMEVKWRVFNGLQRTMNTLSARSSALRSEELERDFRRQLIFNIVQSYNAILLARAQIQIDLSNKTFNEQQLRDIQLKYNAGSSSLTDLLFFKIEKEKAQDRIIIDTASYKILRYELATLMGLTTADLPEDTHLPSIQIVESETYALGVEFYLDMAITQRPDLRAAKLDLDSLKYKLYSTWGAFAPTVDLDLDYGYFTSKADLQGRWIPQGKDLNFNYGFDVNWPIWQGGSRIANVRNTQAQLDIRGEELLNKWITVVKDVRKAYTNLLAFTARVKILKKIMDMALKRRNLTREEYNAGNIDILVLGQAQRDLIIAESRHIQAMLNLSNSRAELLAACGVNVLD